MPQEGPDTQESVPLLDGDPVPEWRGADHRPSTRQSIPAWAWQVKAPRSIIIVATLTKFCIVLSGTMAMLPFFRVFEDALCHQHLNDTSPGFLDEKMCKGDEVQKSLAYFFGWFAFVNAIVGKELHTLPPAPLPFPFSPFSAFFLSCFRAVGASLRLVS